MKQVILYCLLFTKIGFDCLAQIPGTAQASNGTMDNLTFYNLPAKSYAVLSGSPYTKSDFSPGEILPWKGPWQKGYLLRYNTYTQQLEIFENKSIKAPAPQLIQAFKIGEDTFRTGYANFEKNTSATYYQLLYDGKVKLLKYSTTKMEEVRAADDVKQGDQFTTYNYYYLLENEKLSKFLLGKKSFLKIFPEKHLSKIESFIDTKNLSLKEITDYIEVIKYYESII